MSENIDKLRLEERIRLLILKHRGCVELVARDGNVPEDYVRKIIKKVRRKRNMDVDFYVGTTMAQYIMDGSEQRKIYLMEQLREEVEKPIELVSVCCDVSVKEHAWDGESHYTCDKCGKDCVTQVKNTKDKGIIIKLLSELREEDQSIVEFLVKLGFMNKMANGDFDAKPKDVNKQIKSVEIDRKLLEDTSNLDPRSREALRKSLEKRIADTTFVDGELS
jgi:hypothetical protein